MDMNQVEVKSVEKISNEAAEIAIRELSELDLLVTGGGCAIAQFG